MINFANPHLLYLLIAVPVIGLCHVLSRMARKHKLQRYGRISTLEPLMPDASRYLPGIKIILALSALTFIIIAAARPFVKTDRNVRLNGDETSIKGIEVMICCDVSNSMLASANSDPRGISRLQKSKFILEKALDNMTNDRVGLIVFAGNAYTQLPITPDVYSAKMYINDMSVDMVPTQGTAIGAAIDMAVNSFNPESDFQKAIIVVTDGENFEDHAQDAAKHAAEAGIQVDVIGVGTGEPMPIPVNSSRNEYLYYGGEEVRTALDEAGAADIAEAGGGIYLSGSSSSVVSDLKTQLDKIAKTEYKRTAIPSDASDLFPLAIAIALILLLIDVALPYRKLTWLRNIKFFSKK